MCERWNNAQRHRKQLTNERLKYKRLKYCLVVTVIFQPQLINDNYSRNPMNCSWTIWPNFIGSLCYGIALPSICLLRFSPHSCSPPILRRNQSSFLPNKNQSNFYLISGLIIVTFTHLHHFALSQTTKIIARENRKI